MTLIAIVAATLLAGIGSVWVAAALLRLGPGALRAGGAQHLLSLAAGALLATALMHLLPEAFESQASARALFASLLAGVVFFFILDKAELWHHGHEHHQPPAAAAHDHSHSHDHEHSHAHSHAHSPAHDPTHSHDSVHAPGHTSGHTHRGGAWAVLAGDSVHGFGDGVLIASAFVASPKLGVVAALAVLAHEVPHHMGDLVVLAQNHSGARVQRAALVKVSLAGAVTVLGGVAGWWLVEQLEAYLPYFLVLASSSFIYVALADLIPQLQQRLSLRATLTQLLWLGLGVGLVTVTSTFLHGH